jgi:hypothetical protein
LTSTEAPLGEPFRTATLAHAAFAAQVQDLRVARAKWQMHVQELRAQLLQEEARIKRVTRSLERARARNNATMTALVGQEQQVTPEQCGELLPELVSEFELKWELGQISSQVMSRARTLERAQSRLQELEQALASEQARLSATAPSHGLTRSHRLRAMVFARFLWRLLQTRRGLWNGIVRDLYLGMRIVALAVWMLPKADRARWQQESYSELELLKQEEAALLGTAIRTALRIPWLALVLRTGAWRRSPSGRWVIRLEPLWIGLVTAAGTFCAGAAGIGQSPTEGQMRSLVAASLLTGVVAAWQAYKGRRVRRRGRRWR